MSSLDERWRRSLDALPLAAGDRLLVGVSGGADSVALLELLAATAGARRLELVVAHVDHGIDPASGAVGERVRRHAERHGLRFAARRLELGRGCSETAARQARHAALEALRRECDARWIVLAHHAGDQSETVLLRLLRGSGPAGLAGMQAVQGRLLRPLLGFEPAELRALAEALDPWDDPANADLRHDRAWMRHVVLGTIRQRVPDVDRRVAGAARQARAARDAWDRVLEVLPGLALESDADAISVAAPVLGGYDSPLSEALVQAAARRAGIVVGPARAARVVRLARSGRSGARVPLGGAAVAELAFGRLRFVRATEAPPTGGATLGGAAASGEWGRWTLSWRQEPAPATQARNGMAAWFVLEDTLRVRAPQAGDRVVPVGGSGSRPLVRCFQEARVPRSRRAAWPVVVSGERILWAPGVCRAADGIPPEGTEALRVDAAYA